MDLNQSAKNINRRKTWIRLQECAEPKRVFYRSHKKLGRGTFAEVWLGEWDPDPLTGPPICVAIKEFYLNRQTLDRAMQTEIDIMRGLDHPNIVKLVSVIVSRSRNSDTDGAKANNATGANGDTKPNDEDKLYVVLEYCAGGDFRSFIKSGTKGKRNAGISEKWACKYLQQIAEGLRYLRTRPRPIIHRDLKPHNLLLSADHRTLKIADFGFARIVDSEALATTMCGSPLYMAPEVLRGDPYTTKADLWSVGVILYEMLCGHRPYENARDIVELRQQMKVQTPVQFPRKVRIGRMCRELLAGLLQKNPARRISWNKFLNHPWFCTDWGKVRKLKKSSSKITIPTSMPIAIPIPKPRFEMVENYIPIQTTPTTAPMSATTPCGGSDPFGCHTELSSSQYRRPQQRSSSASLKQSLSDLMSSSYGLFCDSFKGTGI